MKRSTYFINNWAYWIFWFNRDPIRPPYLMVPLEGYLEGRLEGYLDGRLAAPIIHPTAQFLNPTAYLVPSQSAPFTQ